MANSIEQGKKEDRRGLHPNSLKNLEKGPIARWKSGQSGNPDGYSLTALVKRYLNEIPDVLIDKKVNTKTWRELITQAWLVGSYKGNATLFKELLERIEGKVAQPITGGQGEPLIPPVARFHLADGTVIKPPRNGHKPVEALPNGDSHKTT